MLRLSYLDAFTNVMMDMGIAFASAYVSGWGPVIQIPFGFLAWTRVAFAGREYLALLNRVPVIICKPSTNRFYM